MSSLRSLRTLSRGTLSAPSRLTVLRHQQARTLTGGPNKSTDTTHGKDSLGGPGGQEPVDPVSRGKQNA